MSLNVVAVLSTLALDFKIFFEQISFLTDTVFKKKDFHLDFHLSLQKACLSNFINFLKFPCLLLIPQTFGRFSIEIINN